MVVVLVLGRSFRISFVSYTFANIWYAKAHTTTPTEMYWCKIGCIVCDSLQCGVIYLSCSFLAAQRAKVKLHMRLVLSQKSMRSHLIKSDNTFYNKLYFACSRTPPHTHTHRYVSDIFAKHKTAILHIFVIKNRRLNRFYLICGKLPAQFFFCSWNNFVNGKVQAAEEWKKIYVPVCVINIVHHAPLCMSTLNIDSPATWRWCDDDDAAAAARRVYKYYNLIACELCIYVHEIFTAFRHIARFCYTNCDC